MSVHSGWAVAGAFILVVVTDWFVFMVNWGLGSTAVAMVAHVAALALLFYIGSRRRRARLERRNLPINEHRP
jgi:Flp pilus assembly protein TadB